MRSSLEPERQLLLASLLMLLVPWAGLRAVLELDSALRQQALQQLQAQGARLATWPATGCWIPRSPPTRAPSTGSTDQAITIDGYGPSGPVRRG